MKKDLTAGQVKALSKKPGFHRVARGLYLDTRKGGASWVHRYMLAGKAHYLGGGSYDLVGHEEALDWNWQQRRKRHTGIDPLAERRAEKAAVKLARAREMTFRQAAELCIRAKQKEWSNLKHAQQWETTLVAYAYPVVGDMPVQAVDTPDVLRVLAPLWDTRIVTAERLRGRIETVLSHATVLGYRVGPNSARWTGHLDHLLAKPSRAHRIEHHAALPHAELPGFMAELRQCDGVAFRALEFTILTAARSGEVLGAVWDEINLSDRMWIVPPERMKAGREHRVPLADRVIKILEEMQRFRVSGFVFPGARVGRGLGPVALQRALRQLRFGCTPHGFRSAFADWCTEKTNFPSEMREIALAHKVGSKTEEAYRRTDLFQKRRQLMDAWEQYCAEPVGGDNVIKLPAAG